MTFAWFFIHQKWVTALVFECIIFDKETFLIMITNIFKLLFSTIPEFY